MQSPQVVKTPAYQSPTSGNFIRTVDMGRPIGIDAKIGGAVYKFHDGDYRFKRQFGEHLSWKDFLIMYYLIMWDKDLASIGRDGCLDKIEIPLDVASFLFRLDAERYPVLSSLSLDDYDMFSGSQIDSLADELRSVICINPVVSEMVKLMIDFMLKAKSLEKNILFDPFRAV